LGHVPCGAIKGAIDNVVLGNLTLLLARFAAAIDERRMKACERRRTQPSSMRSRERRP
jgi:hypothetical protein